MNAEKPLSLLCFLSPSLRTLALSICQNAIYNPPHCKPIFLCNPSLAPSTTNPPQKLEEVYTTFCVLREFSNTTATKSIAFSLHPSFGSSSRAKKLMIGLYKAVNLGVYLPKDFQEP
ncbi:hypothetical protein MKX01_036561 [Papaver californicum]|nr:hypothetical protein MKX01_036561 [Papaver californicum]